MPTICCRTKQLKVCEMHRTREDAERLLPAATAAKGAGALPVVDGSVAYAESQTPAATGAKDPADAPAVGGQESDRGTTEHIGAATTESLQIRFDAPAVGGEDTDTGKTEHIGAAPAESLEIQANAYTQEVAQWLTHLTSKASERGLYLPNSLVEMCPQHHRHPPEYLGCGTLAAQRGLHHDDALT